MPQGFDPNDPRFMAAVEMVGRTGSEDFQIRFSDDDQPVVWIAVANYEGKRIKHADNYDPAIHDRLRGSKLGVGLNPLEAVLSLLKDIFAGGSCQHCGRPSGVSDDWTRQQPLDALICWYVFDPETKTFRRSCENDQ